jgi:hypothetical protein
VEWQEKALESSRVLVRAARSSGKTFTAIKWARNAGRRVIFGVPNQQMVGAVMDVFNSLYREEITHFYRSEGKVVFRDGVQINVMALQNSFRLLGLRADAVVLDEAGYMNESAVISAMACASQTRSFKFFATYSSVPKSGVKLIKRLEEVSHVELITVDYLDLLESGALRADDVRSIQGSMTAKAFAEEMGPYQRNQQTLKHKNALFKHLLTKE